MTDFESIANINTKDNKEDKVEVLKKELKINEKNVLYIMLSTMNQMVNYIPLKFFDFKNTLNITTYDKQNESWDKNFAQVIQNAQHYKINHSELLDISQVKNKLIEELKKKIGNIYFWNITGGQRPTVMAIYDLVGKKHENNDLAFLNDKTHYLCYLEGNTGKMKIMKFHNGKQDDDDSNSYPYAVDGLTIDDALKLMGYEANANPQNVLNDNGFQQKLNTFYDVFFQTYKSNNLIRKEMTGFNSQQSGSVNFNNIIDNFLPIQGLSKSDIKKQWKDFENRKTFGYILEEMLVYLILKIINEDLSLKNKIAGVYPSVKIAANYYKNKTSIDEFDTLILTKTGQVICFECKSGGMEKEAAKSTKYSTYAIGGVYGNSILITPQISKNDVINDSITKAIGYADRANLKVWYIDEIELKNEFKKIK